MNKLLSAFVIVLVVLGALTSCSKEVRFGIDVKRGTDAVLYKIESTTVPESENIQSKDNEDGLYQWKGSVQYSFKKNEGLNFVEKSTLEIKCNNAAEWIYDIDFKDYK